MTFATDNITRDAVAQFQKFDVDTQLALLWYGYLDIKDQLHPGTGKQIGEETARALFDQIQALPQQEQLQAQRDIASGANSPIAHAYTALPSSGRLDLWLLLGKGMEDGSIIPFPSNYQLPAETNTFVNNIKQLDFERRINFTRSIVLEMGAKA